MSRKAMGVCALLAALGCASTEVSAAVIKTAKHASTSNHTVATTTGGQRQILMNVDPLDVASFRLEVSFDADKVQFLGITGLNGYVIDQNYEVVTEGPGGLISGIHGYYPGFNDQVAAQASTGVGAATNNPPAGEVDIFQVAFLDLAPDQDKNFAVFADPFDYINAYNPDTGEITGAVGPYNPATDQGVDPAFSTVAGVNAVPLPGGLGMGLMGGLGILGTKFGRRKKSK